MSLGRRHGNRSTDERVLGRGEAPKLAAHLLSSRGLYTHHGLYAGHERVIHYRGLVAGLRGGPVEEVSLAQFARGHRIRVRIQAASFDDQEVIRRARQRLGERRYRLLSNNCEHLCEWCLRGVSRSAQVEALSRWLCRYGSLGRLPWSWLAARRHRAIPPSVPRRSRRPSGRQGGRLK
jgi:Lecithin retinol acyltransferase